MVTRIYSSPVILCLHGFYGNTVLVPCLVEVCMIILVPVLCLNKKERASGFTGDNYRALELSVTMEARSRGTCELKQ